MPNKFTVLFLLLYMNIFSQEKIKNNDDGIDTITSHTSETGKVENRIYNCGSFKWKIKIPENYFLTEEKELEKLEEKGNEEIKKNLQRNIRIQNRRHLIGFKLDNQNTFSASFNPLDKTQKITLDEHQKLILELLKKAFSKIENAKFEFKTSKEKLGDYQFYKIKVEGYNKLDNKLVITQIYYNSFIKENLFGVLITYNSTSQGELLETNFLNSLNN